MKKLFVTTFLMLAVPIVIQAQGNQTELREMQQKRIQDQAASSLTTTPEDNQIQNNYQVTTGNQGQDTQMEIKTREEEGTGGGQYGQNRNQNAYEHMSIVAQKVAELQMLGDRDGGLGQQVREIAQNQNQSQEKVQADLIKLESRQGWLKSLIGPDFSAIKNIKMEMEQNRVRIQQLEQLQNQMINQGDEIAIQEMVQALTAENEALQNMLTQEEGTKSMLGWLFKFLVK